MCKLLPRWLQCGRLPHKSKWYLIFGSCVWMTVLASFITVAAVINNTHCTAIAAHCNVTRVDDLYAWRAIEYAGGKPITDGALCAYTGDAALEPQEWEIADCYYAKTDECPSAKCEPTDIVEYLIIAIVAVLFIPTLFIIIAVVSVFMNGRCNTPYTIDEEGGASNINQQYSNTNGTTNTPPIASDSSNITNSSIDYADETLCEMEDVELYSTSSSWDTED